MTILNNLTPEQLAFVEAELSNDALSTDEELIALFMTADLTLEQAKVAVAYRHKFLTELLPTGYLLFITNQPNN